MKRTLRAVVSTFLIVLARETATRLAKNWVPKQKPKRKKKKHGVS